MVGMSVVGPYCQSDHIVKRGKTETGKQRYRCHNEKCSHHSFLLDPAYKGRLPEIKQQVIEISLNGSGVCDTARVLQISTAPVIAYTGKTRLLLGRPIPGLLQEPVKYFAELGEDFRMVF